MNIARPLTYQSTRAAGRIRPFSLPINFLLIFMVTCFNFSYSFGTKNLYAADQNRAILQSKLKIMHLRAAKYMAEQHFERAEAILDSILAIQPEAEAFYQLGVIKSKEEKTYLIAEAYFKKALKLNHKFSKAYYELGLLYQKGPFLKDDAIENLRWAIYYDKNLKDAYYQRALLIMEYQDYRRGHKQMRKSVLSDPIYKNCYDLYLKIGFTFHQFDGMAELLRRLISKYPSEKNFQLDLIAVEYRNGQYDNAQNLLNQFRQAHPKFQPAALWLNESRILFALGQDTLATELYWKGVDAIQAAKDADDYFKDMVMLVDDDECDEYYRTKLPEMKDYFYRFWKSRDLTLTTTFNDRLSEHYRRLRYAQKYNRRYPEKKFLATLLNDNAGIVDNNNDSILGQYSATRGSKNQNEIDDQGVIYVRHGAPDAAVTYFPGGMKDVNRNLSWCYHSRGDRPKMIFHFRMLDARENSSMNEGWQLEIFPTYLHDRELLDGRYLRRSQYPELTRENIQNIQLATRTETSNFAPAFGQFDIPFDYFIFQQPPRQLDVFFYYYTPSDARPDPNLPQPYHLKHEFVVLDRNWKEMMNSEKQESASGIKTFPDAELNRKYHVPLKSGIYYAGLRMVNTQTKREGNLRIRINVPDYVDYKLKMSSVMLGNSLLNDSLIANYRHKKSIADRVKPNIQRKFSANEPVLIYFELYNLFLNRTGMSDFSVTLKIAQLERYKSNLASLFSNIQQLFIDEKLQQVSIQDNYSDTNQTEYILRNISLPEYVPGRYELTIIVQDKVAKVTLAESLKFEIVN